MEFTLITRIKASPELVYKTWLDSEGHSQMTGGEASITDQIGAEFSAWDGYIEGKNLELEPGKRMLQTWRTTEFVASEEDSILEILLKEVDGETELPLIHTKLPAHGEQYRTGWENHYFEPMRAYFASIK